MVHVPISSQLVGNHAPAGLLCKSSHRQYRGYQGAGRQSNFETPWAWHYPLQYGILKAPPWVNTVPLTFARCVGGTPWFWACWSPLLRRRWPMPAVLPGRAIPTTTASKSPEQTTSCVPACTFSPNQTVSVRDTASRPPQVAMLLKPPIPLPKATSITACAGACKCTQIPTTSVPNAASRSTQATMGPTKVAGNA